MFIPWKIPDPFIRLISITEQATGYQLALASVNTIATCPKCHCRTAKRHSTYTRYLRDLPCAGLAVTICLKATKWHCLTTTCTQRIFTERFSWLTPYARRTIRATNLLRYFAFSSSCIIAAKLAKVTGLAVSHDTLLRIIYQTNVKPRAISSVIGIDEFAWRKGHTYGTIICDFITSRTVAILQDRQPETVTAWLKQHPHIQIVSRDGLLVFKEAIHAANPTIEQISDRWHFIKNCKKRLDDLLLSTIPSSVEKKQAPTETAILPLAKYEERALERKESKRQLIARVQIAYKAGHSMQQLAKQFQLNPRTIKKYITAGDSWLETPRAKKRHPFHKRILYLEEERMIVKKIHATLVKEGFSGAYGATRMTVEAIRKTRRIQLDAESSDLIKRPQISVLLWKWSQQLTSKQSQWLRYLFGEYPILKDFYELVQTFRKSVETRDYQRFLKWLTQQLSAQSQPFYSYASRLRQDLKAVKNAFDYPYNNGFVEGHVNRLKTEKRRLYGRASVVLLEKRILFRY